jgi:hypothetical protein
MQVGVGKKLSERRARTRICVPFPAHVRGTDAKGEEFSIETVLDNLSSNGLYLRMMPAVGTGARLTIVVDLATSPRATEDASRFSINGSVLRTDTIAGGILGVAVGFDSIHFH